EVAKEILEYEAFTDIEFNPKRSFNCQAEACAIYVSLVKRKKLQEALKSIDDFEKFIY
ncbi:DarT1-associated NADAR antitoxin family protein, partial [Staphylococcus ureilyticus]|uniref:DarT1-associated NADAR antitoxin family protein n=2 Tax=Bacillales TaxID=1385 RepID=UPI003F69270D